MELTTARLLLAPLDPDRDAEALHMAFSDPDVMRWWNTPLRVEVADTRRDLVNSLDGEEAHMWVVHEAGRPSASLGYSAMWRCPVSAGCCAGRRGAVASWPRRQAQ